MTRAFVSAALVLAMWAFGFGVYHAAGYLKAARTQVQRPTSTSGPSLPGTIYVTQGGAIYKYQGGRFIQVTSEQGWTQPAAAPSGDELVAVKRDTNFSDIYLLQRSGRVVAQLTHNRSTTVEANHWAFYPRFSPDGSQLFYDYDPKDPYNNYRVDLAIYSSPSNPAAKTSVKWTYPNYYTGGDVTPVPLRGGGLVYTRFSIDAHSAVHSQVWLQLRPGSPGVALTEAAADCLQPAVSPDATLIAMVCTGGDPQTARLVVATFLPAALKLGPSTVLVQGKLVASPAFSPDGGSIAFLAPGDAGGAFQLWTVASGTASDATAPEPRQITTQVGLDATSAPVWVS
jgi:Tol biopolymer transport system component